jgi:hypothetical protein
VEDSEPLLRRIQPLHYREGQPPSSAAFKNPELSVDREHMLAAAKDACANYPGNGLARIPTAKIPRDLGLEVAKDPLTNNLAHALVRGKKTDSVAKKLARCVQIVETATPTAVEPQAPGPGARAIATTLERIGSTESAVDVPPTAETSEFDPDPPISAIRDQTRENMGS